MSSLSLRLPKRDERGFTLIELLVVIIIIGILAAVAIPLFLDQRKLAADAAVKSDVRNTSTQVQTWLSQNPGTVATDATAYTAAGGKVVASNGDTVGVSVATDGTYLVCGYTSAATGKVYNSTSAAYVFDSTTGKFGTGTCSGGIVGGGSSSSPAASTPAPVAPTITNTGTTLPAGTVGDGTYDTFITATGPGTLTYGATGLPGGLSINTATGEIKGTPTIDGTFTVTATVASSNGTSATPKNFTLTVAKAPVAPTITTTSLPDGKVGVAYDQTLTATGGTGTTTWALSSGTLPSWLQFNTATGRLYGTPTSGSYGTVSLGFTATASGKTSNTQNLSLRVSEDIALTNSNAELAGPGGGGWGPYWSNPADFTNIVGHNSSWSYTGAMDSSGGPVQGAQYCYTGTYKTGVAVKISMWVTGSNGSSWNVYSRANNWEGWGTAAGSGGGAYSNAQFGTWKQYIVSYTPDGNAGPLCIGANQSYSAGVSGQRIYMDDITLTLG